MERELQDAARKLEIESERLVRYLNDEVVPAVRSKSSRALRIAAERIRDFADSMDDSSSSTGPGGKK